MSSSKDRFKHLSARDFELLATLSERIHYTNPNEPFLNHLYVVLNEAIHNTVFSVDSYSVNPIFFKQATSDSFSDELCAIYRRYMMQHPLLKRLVSFRNPGVYTILSETTPEKFHKTDLYQKFYKVLGIEDQLALRLVHPRGIYLVVYSRDTPFSEKERAFMELLKPQLYIALRNWQRVRELEKHLRTLEEKVAVEEQSVEMPFNAKQLIDSLSPRQRAPGARSAARGSPGALRARAPALA